jgi:hypothetical protein
MDHENRDVTRDWTATRPIQNFGGEGGYHGIWRRWSCNIITSHMEIGCNDGL